jgi:hypothetical protein
VAKVLQYHSSLNAESHIQTTYGPDEEDNNFIDKRIKVCEEASEQLDDLRERLKETAKHFSSYSDCPACGMMTLRRNGGCMSCTACGYSSC